MLRAELLQAGHDVNASLSSPLALLETIARLSPDVIVIDVDTRLAEANLKLSERKRVEKAKLCIAVARLSGSESDGAPIMG